MAGHTSSSYAFSQLLGLVASGEATSRAALARITGMARSTVGHYVDRLLELGLCDEVEESAGERGRPPRRLTIGSRSLWSVVIDVGSRRSTVGFFKLDERLQRSQDLTVSVTAGAQPLLDDALGVISVLREELGLHATDIAMVVVSVPAPVDVEGTRIAHRSAMLSWAGFPIAGYLSTALGCRVVVENDANVLAVGEAAARDGEQTPLLLLALSAGIGAGVVMAGGVVHRGSDGVAGDVGHIRSVRQPGVPCVCGRTGCVGASASLRAIITNLGIEGSSYRERLGELRRRIEAHDPDTRESIREAAGAIGELAAMMVDVLNPRSLVITGDMVDLNDDVISIIRSEVYSNALPAATARLTIKRSAEQRQPALQGGVRLARQWLLSSAGVTYLWERTAVHD